MRPRLGALNQLLVIVADLFRRKRKFVLDEIDAVENLDIWSPVFALSLNKKNFSIFSISESKSRRGICGNKLMGLEPSGDSWGGSCKGH
ncbi:hypothetical protein H9L39_05666 [Fusarium oxysporum f. sp. albedinis]|nr:hypothetical protein H9L39_05666 [Fusarium oxysporum f. sp. albedinis]